MVFESRKFGIKYGIIITIISFVFLTQTGLKGFLIPSIEDYTGIVIPTTIFGINLVITAWILFIAGIIMLILGAFDLPPFNF